MKTTTIASLLGLLGTLVTTIAQPQTLEAKIAPLRAPVIVTEVQGSSEYAYDSTGWKPLATGKILQPGASVRTSGQAVVVLKTMNAPSFIKVSPGTQLHLTLEAPAEERPTAGVAKVLPKAKALAQGKAGKR